MRREVRFAGFGGQGVVKAALLMTLAAGLHEGREVAQTQSYGPEARGGACRSEVVISDEEIDFIKPIHTDLLAVMSQPAMDKYAEGLDSQATVVVDSTLVKDVPERFTNVFSLDATRLAEEELGKALFANIIMLGAVAAVSDIVAIEALEASLPGNVPDKTLTANTLALRLGFEQGKRQV